MAQANGRQFVKYSFYKVDPAWRRLSQEKRLDNKREFAAVVAELETDMMLRCYSLVGMRGGSQSDHQAHTLARARPHGQPVRERHRFRRAGRGDSQVPRHRVPHSKTDYRISDLFRATEDPEE